MRNGIFRRIFIIYAIIVLTAALFSEVYITSAVRENYIGNLRKHLEDNIALLLNDISFSRKDTDDFCRETKEKIHARVTIILEDGRVIGDSDHDSATMDNHAGRIEVQQASGFGTGMTIRHSNTLGYDFLYIARKVIRDRGETGFVRLAVPLKDIDSSVNLLRARIIFVVLAVLLLTLGVSVWQTDHLRRLLRQITDFSRSLSKGEIDKRLFLSKAGEFEEIADNLTAMSIALKSMISQIDEERNRLNVILRSVPDALLIIDARGMVTLSSSSSRDMLGDFRGPGVHFADIIRSHEFSSLIAEVRTSLSPGMTEISLESTEKNLTVKVSPLFYRERELSGFVAVFHDITEIRKLEQVRKDFVANVSHELKTPITAIRGFADTLLDGALEDSVNAARFVETIRSNSERINALVDDLMTISKIELGVIKVEKSVVDIHGVFENVMELYKPKASSKGLFLKILEDPDMRQVEADRNRLIKILTNLVDNAIKFTETGGVTFGLEKSRDGHPCICVEDTGIGVPAKSIERLGERFFRVDPARSRKMGGTGLGLAIVKHLVKAHGWRMQIESTQGNGTKVKIII